MIHDPTKDILNKKIRGIKNSIQAGDTTKALQKCEKLVKFVNIQPSFIDAMCKGLTEAMQNRKEQFMRVFSKDHDSGWRMTGNDPFASAKRYAKNHIDGEEVWFLSKADMADEKKRTPETAYIHVDEPWPVWHRGPKWANQIPIPTGNQD